MNIIGSDASNIGIWFRNLMWRHLSIYSIRYQITIVRSNWLFHRYLFFFSHFFSIWFDWRDKSRIYTILYVYCVCVCLCIATYFIAFEYVKKILISTSNTIEQCVCDNTTSIEQLRWHNETNFFFFRCMNRLGACISQAMWMNEGRIDECVSMTVKW